VYIRRLRAKMRWDRDTGWIRTIRSYGYRLDPVDRADVPEPSEHGTDNRAW